MLDALTLLSNQQSIAILGATSAILVAMALVNRARKPGHKWKGVIITIVSLLLSFAAVEAAAALLPRPMASLRVANPDIVRVDFHSHTGASHDVRKSFTSERNREWHRSGGFDVAYVTDHVNFDGAVAARALNPPRAGDGMSLLTGVEGRYHRIMSIIMLGLDERDAALLNRRGNLLPGQPAAGRGAVTIVALPNRNLDSVTIASLDSLPHFTGIELVDAAPRGLAQLDREEEKIRRIASDLRLILVAASNNHGWGRTVAAWNLMTIPGWRTLPPDSIGTLIERQFRERRLDAVTIVRRVRPSLHGAAAVATLPALVYQVIASLTLAERGVWLAWIWGITGLTLVMKKRLRRVA